MSTVVQLHNVRKGALLPQSMLVNDCIYGQVDRVALISKSTRCQKVSKQQFQQSKAPDFCLWISSFMNFFKIHFFKNVPFLEMTGKATSDPTANKE